MDEMVAFKFPIAKVYKMLVILSFCQNGIASPLLEQIQESI